MERALLRTLTLGQTSLLIRSLPSPEKTRAGARVPPKASELINKNATTKEVHRGVSRDTRTKGVSEVKLQAQTALFFPPLAETTFPKGGRVSEIGKAGADKNMRLKALNISKRNSMFICSLM